MLHYLVMLPHYNESKMLPCPLATPEVAVDYCNAAHPSPRKQRLSLLSTPIVEPSKPQNEGNVTVIIKIGCSH